MPDPDAELTALVEAHRSAIEVLLHLRERLADGENVRLDLTVASHREVRARMRLLNWEAPTRKLSESKLEQVLANAILAKIPYDELSLKLIRDEPARFTNRARKPNTRP